MLIGLTILTGFQRLWAAWVVLLIGFFCIMTSSLSRIPIAGLPRMCTRNCYCWFYCSAFQLFWSRPYLYNSWLTCSMRGDGTNETCDVSLLMSCHGCIAIQQLLSSFLSSSKSSPKHCWSSYPLPFVVGQHIVWRGTMANIVFHWFHPSTAQLADQFFHRFACTQYPI